MKNILISSTRLNGSHLAKKIAEDNPEVNIDLVGARLRCVLPKNLRYLGEDLKPSDNIRRIKEIHKNYDFICAADLSFQFSLDFQNWRESIDIPVFCPSRECSFLEFSKLLSKKILNKLEIPTADFEKIQEDDYGRILDLQKSKFYNSKFILKLEQPSISNGFTTHITDVSEYKIIVSEFRKLARDFFVEEFLTGKEISAHFLCNGDQWVYLGSARDYKKIYNNDVGQNCNSTGSYSPVSYVDNTIETQMFSYVDRILKFLNSEGIFYKGILYLGLLVDSKNIVNVLEINTRPGNPEFSVILSTIKSKNLLENIYNASNGDKLSSIEFNDLAVVGINLLNKNYLNSGHRVSKIPTLVPNEKFINCYYNGLIYGNNYLMNIINTGRTHQEAADEIYSWVDQQDLGDYRYRTDIGKLI
jgi:phosphoribosylamine-glycine ligase